jgi:hypothetical protein
MAYETEVLPSPNLEVFSVMYTTTVLMSLFEITYKCDSWLLFWFCHIWLNYFYPYSPGKKSNGSNIYFWFLLKSPSTAKYAVKVNFCKLIYISDTILIPLSPRTVSSSIWKFAILLLYSCIQTENFLPSQKLLVFLWSLGWILSKMCLTQEFGMYVNLLNMPIEELTPS